MAVRTRSTPAGAPAGTVAPCDVRRAGIVVAVVAPAAAELDGLVVAVVAPEGDDVVAVDDAALDPEVVEWPLGAVVALPPEGTVLGTTTAPPGGTPTSSSPVGSASAPVT